MPDVHLLVMCHGMWGDMSHFNYFVDQLKEKGAVSHDSGPIEFRSSRDGVPQLVVYRTHTNQGYFTYDGIDVCGMRVANEICDEIGRVEAAGGRVTKLSLMGYSMGGIMVRYAAGVLYTRGIFDRIGAHTLTTFCAPHVGVNVLGDRLSSRIFNFIGSWSMARTSRQVFLRDVYSKSGTPLFLHMTEPDTPYMKALKLFSTRTLYANVVNDRRCEYYTASIEAVDPFQGRSSQIKGTFVPGYAPVVLDGTKNVRFAAQAPPVRPKSWLARLFRILFVASKVSLALPLWFIAFLINAGYQALRSNVRTADVLKSSSHIPEYEYSAMSGFLEDEANDLVEDMYGAVSDDRGVLQLTPVMRVIEDQLNTVGWQKFPVHISSDTNTHAAAIVRDHKRKSFWQGKYVVKHWIEQVLELGPTVTPVPGQNKL